MTTSRVAGGNGSLAAATPAAPTGSSANSNRIAKRSPTASSTRTAWAITSGPMPSPGSTATENVLTASPPDPLSLRRGGTHTMGLFVSRDARFLEQRAADFVQAAQQQLAAVRIGAERDRNAAVVRHQLCLQIHHQLV